jgi:two-component system KDP operon response regulator KdpE
MSSKPEHTAPPPRLLLIESDLRVRRYLSRSFAGRGYRVTEAGTGDEAVAAFSRSKPEVLVLDLGPDAGGGFDVLAHVRSISNVPVITYSARATLKQKVHALDAGADDYLTVPFAFEELAARVRAVLRRALWINGRSNAIFESRALRVDLIRRRVEVNGSAVRLTAIEYRLLAALVRHAGAVVPHDRLLEEVWGPRGAERVHYLRVYVASLRRKLESSGGSGDLLVTEIGMGYGLRVDEPPAS